MLSNQRSRHRARRLASVGAIGAGMVLLGAGAAGAQSLTGGCRAAISGRALPSMTLENPLVVAKGKAIRATVSAPSSNPRGRTNLSGTVGPISKSYSFKGTRYNRTVEPPSWLFTAIDGVVPFSGTATGSGFSCAGDGYVKIEGDGMLSLLGGALLGAGGAAGVVSASGPKTPPTREELAAKAELDKARALVQTIKEVARDLAKEFGASAALIIVMILLQIFVFGIMS